jgi:hypothetical protein
MRHGHAAAGVAALFGSLAARTAADASATSRDRRDDWAGRPYIRARPTPAAETVACSRVGALLVPCRQEEVRHRNPGVEHSKHHVVAHAAAPF